MTSFRSEKTWLGGRMILAGVTAWMASATLVAQIVKASASSVGKLAFSGNTYHVDWDNGNKFVDSQRPLQPPLEQDGFESVGRGVYSGLSTVK
jgi:opacity protein-like surface antigen